MFMAAEEEQGYLERANSGRKPWRNRRECVGVELGDLDELGDGGVPGSKNAWEVHLEVNANARGSKSEMVVGKGGGECPD